MSEPLSVEAAIGLLDAAPASAEPNELEDNAAPAQAGGAEDQSEVSDDPTVETTDAPLDEASEGEEEGAQGDSADPPIIAAPKSWDAEARAAFAQLPRAAQEKIAAREDERDRAVSKAIQEASDTRKRAEAEASTIGQFKAQLDDLIPRAQKTFADRWHNVDWAAWSQVDPAAAQTGRFMMEQEQVELARLNAAHQVTQTQQQQRYLAEQGQKLADIAPDLVDPKEGPARKAAVAKFLSEQGASPQEIAGLSAAAVAVAYDAMRFRQGQAQVRQAKPAPAPAKPGVKPTAAQTVRPQQRTVETAKTRFAQSRSVDDAIALLNARTG